MKKYDITVITNDTEWQRAFAAAIKDHSDLYIKNTYNGYDDIPHNDVPISQIVVVDIDLAADHEQSYNVVKALVSSYNPKLPFVVGFGERHQKYINADSDRYGIDLYGKRHPIDESVKITIGYINAMKDSIGKKI